MDFFLAFLAGMCIIAGFVGAIIPAVPGPPISWLGILLLHFSSYAEFSILFLVITAIIMAIITAIDLYIPIWGTKKFGGTKAGIIGSTLGLLAGLFFFPPFGAIVGPFVGAFLGELIMDSKDASKALKSATGSFIGFLLGTGMKLAFCGVMAFYFINAFFN